jgi:uncharacterized protein YraI
MNITRGAIAAGLAGLAFLVAPALAQAAQGFVASPTSLRAGPGGQFPDVDRLPAGAPVTVFGCLGGRSWCDVGFRGDRGWVAGQDLEIFYQNRRVRIVEVSPTFVPAVSFSVSSYWDRYYRGRPFFRDRDRFAGVNVNIGSGGNAVAGRTGRTGEVTASVNGGNANAVNKSGGPGNRRFVANANAACPAGEKNCKTPGKAGMNGKMAAGSTGMNKEKTATAGKTTGGGAAMTGSIGNKAGHKKCQPGTAGCTQGAAPGGANAGSGAGGGNATGGAPPAQ